MNNQYETSPKVTSSVELKYNKYALTGFIISLFWFGGVASLIGLIISCIGYKKAKLMPAKGNDLALMGIIIGAAGVLVTLAIIGLFALLDATNTSLISQTF